MLFISCLYNPNYKYYFTPHQLKYNNKKLVCKKEEVKIEMENKINFNMKTK